MDVLDSALQEVKNKLANVENLINKIRDLIRQHIELRDDICNKKQAIEEKMAQQNQMIKELSGKFPKAHFVASLSEYMASSVAKDNAALMGAFQSEIDYQNKKINEKQSELSDQQRQASALENSQYDIISKINAAAEGGQ